MNNAPYPSASAKPSSTCLSAGVPLIRAGGLTLVLDTPKGRGVFAAKHIPAKTIIEVCPVLVFSTEDNEHHISKSVLQHYTYNWPSSSTSSSPSHSKLSQAQALSLGLGSLFNHSTRNQNVTWTRDLTAQTITYSTCRDVAEGDELCISYGRLWFTDADGVAEGEEEAAEEAETLGKIGDGVLS